VEESAVFIERTLKYVRQKSGILLGNKRFFLEGGGSAPQKNRKAHKNLFFQNLKKYRPGLCPPRNFFLGDWQLRF
jgi:hypothetical protein